MDDQTPGSGGDIEIGGGTGTGTGGTSATVLSSGFSSGVDKGELLAIGIVVLAVIGIIFLIKGSKKAAEPDRTSSKTAKEYEAIGEASAAKSAGMSVPDYRAYLDRVDQQQSYSDRLDALQAAQERHDEQALRDNQS
ncbi:hypothetical protein G7069_08750 [Lysobacter sp. HDW10]|uniref:hypothetical protein n=1 Tax=Lysobacter sp. HDW10 TaxID=2714936 RepID=UPI00140CE2B9|nr:hypothetical protein [Lysobacter sp. HDW10]QIK81674.1 hypothetical protein G7069_08750 [Lysobacter sp. HDW10]